MALAVQTKTAQPEYGALVEEYEAYARSRPTIRPGELWTLRFEPAGISAVPQHLDSPATNKSRRALWHHLAHGLCEHVFTPCVKARVIPGRQSTWHAWVASSPPGLFGWHCRLDAWPEAKGLPGQSHKKRQWWPSAPLAHAAALRDALAAKLSPARVEQEWYGVQHRLQRLQPRLPTAMARLAFHVTYTADGPAALDLLGRLPPHQWVGFDSEASPASGRAGAGELQLLQFAWQQQAQGTPSTIRVLLLHLPRVGGSRSTWLDEGGRTGCLLEPDRRKHPANPKMPPWLVQLARWLGQGRQRLVACGVASDKLMWRRYCRAWTLPEPSAKNDGKWAIGDLRCLDLGQWTLTPAGLRHNLGLSTIRNLYFSDRAWQEIWSADTRAQTGTRALATTQAQHANIDSGKPLAGLSWSQFKDRHTWKPDLALSNSQPLVYGQCPPRHPKSKARRDWHRGWSNRPLSRSHTLYAIEDACATLLCVLKATSASKGNTPRPRLTVGDTRPVYRSLPTKLSTDTPQPETSQ